MKLEAVFFDFDGVILDSVDVKTNAFASMFKKYGELITKRVVEHHLRNGGISRYEKIRFYYQEFLKENISKETLSRLCDEFSKNVVRKVINSPYIPGAYNTLEILYIRGIPMFIVSGTPQEELEKIVSTKGIRKFFIEVYGSPMRKIQILNEIEKKYQYNFSNCLMFGDALSDYEAATLKGANFIGIINKDNSESTFPKGTTVSTKVDLEILNIKNLT